MYLYNKTCEDYYCQQVGGGADGIYFQGVGHQRGYGLFSNIIRYITPIAIKAGKYLGKHLLNTGSKVISDVTSGSSLKDAAKSRFRETSKKIKEDIIHKIQSGSGIKRKKPCNKIHSKRYKPGKRRTKNSDIFS